MTRGGGAAVAAAAAGDGSGNNGAALPLQAALAKNDVKPSSAAAAVLANLEPNSLPLHLPRQLDARRMRAFESRPLQRFAVDFSGGGGGSDEQQQQQEADGGQRCEFVTDSLLYAGAPAWALDWCPWPAHSRDPGPAAARELLAVATHPKGLPRSRVGAAQRGPGSLQLWAVPHGAAAAPGDSGGDAGAAARQAALLPRCLALIHHDARVCWDLKWCPDAAALVRGGAAALAGGGDSGSGNGSGAQVPLAGLLAAVLGDGSVRILAVPSAAYLAGIQERAAAACAATAAAADDDSAAAAAAAAQVPVLDLPPAAVLTAAANGGALASCCAWHPAAPHGLLLIGCWDGHVAVWRPGLAAAAAAGGAGGGDGGSGDSSGSAQLVLRIRAEQCAVRGVTWHPDPSLAEAAAAGADAAAAAAATRVFATASQAGDLKLWAPAEQPFAPLHARSLGSGPAAMLAWGAAAGAIAGALADGGPRVLFTSLVGVAGAARLYGRVAAVHLDSAPDAGGGGAVWAVSFHPTQRALAYAGDAGVTGLVPIEPPLGTRRRQKPAAALGALVIDAAGEAWALTPAELPEGSNAGLFQGGQSHRGGGGGGDASAQRRGVLHDPRQAAFAVAFSPNTVGGAAMLATGTAAGFVRVQRLLVMVDSSGADTVVE